MSTPAVVIGLLAVVFGPALTYFVATRNASGRIQTSQASDLWQESASIRQYLSQQVDKLDQRIHDLEKGNYELRLENGRLQHQCQDLTRENEQLRAEVAGLKQTIKGLR